MSKILALGDCNTLGVENFKGNAYAERFAKKLDKSVVNCGFTMSSTNEMLHFYQDFKDDETEIILIQYGLVDSWKTFKYSPYVLYYPDNKVRKFGRKIVKKYKKIAKKIGFNKFFGTTNVVALDAYERNIEYIIQQAQNCTIFLIDTIPNMDISRNHEIMKYNQVLSKLSKQYAHVYYVDIYDDFINRNEYYLDNTHMNEKAYELVSQKLFKVYLENILKKNI